ncbi:MAG: type II toxin-antitoxin system VapC family toxin [Planctomycetaceae bacterium]
MPRRKKDPTRPTPQPEQFVLDCSVVFAWYFSDEADVWADSVAQSLAGAQAIVPAHWPLEVANTLLMGERRKRSTEAQATAFVGYIQNLPIEIDDSTATQAWSVTLSHARTQGLSAYDAAYIELAMRRRLPLATLDSELKRAAQALHIRLYAPTVAT